MPAANFRSMSRLAASANSGIFGKETLGILSLLVSFSRISIRRLQVRYFYNYPADDHIKTLKNLATWGKEANIAALKEDFAKLKPHVERISAKNPANWEAFVKTYDEIVSGQ